MRNKIIVSVLILVAVGWTSILEAQRFDYHSELLLDRGGWVLDSTDGMYYQSKSHPDLAGIAIHQHRFSWIQNENSTLKFYKRVFITVNQDSLSRIFGTENVCKPATLN